MLSGKVWCFSGEKLTTLVVHHNNNWSEHQERDGRGSNLPQHLQKLRACVGQHGSASRPKQRLNFTGLINKAIPFFNLLQNVCSFRTLLSNDPF